MSKSPLESTWLYHEIGRCQLESGNHAEARDFGEKSAAAAEEAEDELWQLNATVLIAQADVKLGEYQSTLDYFQKALDLAQVQGDDAAEAAIKRAMDEVNNRIVQGLKEAEEPKEETKEETATEEEKEPEPEPEQDPKPELEPEEDSPKEEEKVENTVDEETAHEQPTEDKTQEETKTE